RLAVRRPFGELVHGVLLHAPPLRPHLRRPSQAGSHLRMIEIFRKPNYDFIGKRRWAYYVSIAFTLIGIISLAAHGGLRYDIDFTGGTLVQVRFEQPVGVDKIRASLSKIGLGESVIQQFGDPREFILRMPLTAEGSEQLGRRVQATMSADPALGKFDIRRVEFVGPQVGRDLQLQA